MRRPEGSLEPSRDAIEDNPRLVVVGVHLHRIGNEDEVGARRLEKFEVALLVARVAREILGRRELGRVHEQADHGRCVLLDGLPHEGDVPLVEVSHRRHEAHGRREVPSELAEFRNSACHDHDRVEGSFRSWETISSEIEKLSFSVGKLPAATSDSKRRKASDASFARFA